MQIISKVLACGSFALIYLGIGCSDSSPAASSSTGEEAVSSDSSSGGATSDVGMAGGRESTGSGGASLGLNPSGSGGSSGIEGEGQSSPRFRVGDPDVSFDRSRMDPAFPQMDEWITAGVRGGIPYLDDVLAAENRTDIDPGDQVDIQTAIDEMAELGGGTVVLRNGTYAIEETLRLKSQVHLVGESRDGVVLEIAMERGNGIYFGEEFAGIYRLTVQGGWGEPRFKWNYGSSFSAQMAELPDNENVAVMFKNTSDCFLDGVNIFDAGDFPLRSNAQHITLRDLDVDGVHNKHGGAHGYFFILNSHHLITESRVTHLRHLSLQGDNVEYNVLYGNHFEQEISFHAGDNGNNLIENNEITLPEDMPGGGDFTIDGVTASVPDYRAVMGPWSGQHELSFQLNFLYRNTCVEENHGGNQPWSDPAKIYAGPVDWNKGGVADVFPSGDELPAQTGTQPGRRPPRDLPSHVPVPQGGTLYPVVLGESEGAD